MTATEKRKFLDAVEQIERDAGSDAPLSPEVVLRMFLAQFPSTWIELVEPLATAQAMQLIASRQGFAVRARRPAMAQMTLSFPGFDAMRVPLSIRVPPTTKAQKFGRGRRGQWGKTLEVSVADFGLYMRQQATRLEHANAKRKAKFEQQQKLYKAARAEAHGDFNLSMGEALARLAKKKGVPVAEALGFDFGA